MLCPYCLKENTIKKIEDRGRPYYVCSEHPDPIIPIIYAEKKIPVDVISAVGFPAHGKSVYFTSLFSSLDALARPNIWPNFFTLPVNEQALDTINDNVKLLKGGKLPGKTPLSFPLPTIVQFSNMPRFKERFLIFYDTSGESYKRASTLIKNASFVTKSQTAIFFISLHDLEDTPKEMHGLLAVYIQGLKELGGNLKQQHLLVVLTKGDLLASKLESHKQIWDYLINGDVKNLRYSDINSQMAEMKKISKLLKDFLIEDVGASMFISLGKENFRDVEFCIISALGAAPKGDQLDISSTPKRIFDPILWVMNNSTGPIPIILNLINSSSNFIKNKINALKTRTSTKKETVAKKPINYRNTAKYGAVSLIGVAAIFFIFFSPFQIPNFIPKNMNDNQQIPSTITIQNPESNAIFLPEGEVIEDSLATGWSKTYYFNVDPPEKIRFIRLSVKGEPFTDFDFIVGKGYVPTFKPKRYDIISDNGLQTEGYDISNPMSGRYYVVVKNTGASGKYIISKNIFYNQ